MEQINAGILKLMTFAPGAHVNMTKNDFTTKREEPTFDALLEQKSGEARSEVVNDRKRPDEPSEKKTETEEVKTDKEPAAEKKEEENCDIAREAASSQIVWLMGQNNQDLLVERQEDVAVIEQPMIFATNDEPATELGEITLPHMAQEVQATTLQTADTVPEGTFEAEVEAIVEAAPEAVAPETEANVGGEQNFETDVEIHVTGRDTDETGGEAAVETPLFEAVEAAPIKVAEAPERPQETRNVEQQVTEKLTDLLDGGDKRVELQLEPIELGKLTIELKRSENGTLNILINAENLETRHLLEKHISNLQEALFERGQQSVQITVERGEESQRQDGQQQHNDFQDDGSNRQNEQQQRRNNHTSGEDFLQQLRLGLIPIEDEDED